MTRTVHRSCTLCEALCGLDIEVDDGGTITSITGDSYDPLSAGYLCPKGTALADLHTDPDRLKRPVAKQPDGSFAEISWTEAFDRTGDEIRRIQGEHGKDAFAIYFGNPSAHNSGSIFLLPFLKLLGTRNRYSATTTDQAPQALAAYKMFGHQALFPLPDVDRTDFLLILGANPAVSNGSLVTAPNFKQRIKDVRGRGGDVVVIDPRFTETAKIASAHHFIQPGTDAVLVAAMISVIFDEGLDRLGAVEGIVDGVAALRAAVESFDVETAARVTGIAADDIRDLAIGFARAPAAVAYNRVGVCQTRFGSVTSWLVNALNIVTGRLDTPGGAMFANPAADMHWLVAQVLEPGSYDGHRSRVRNLPEINGEFPVATLADEILTPGDGQVRGLMVNAGNPVLSAPNGARLDAACEQLEFMVSIDFYINETNRHADIILPPTGPLERDHYDLVFHALAVRNTAKFSPRVFEPEAGTKHDHEIILELAGRLGRGPLFGPLLGPLRWLSKVVDPMKIVDLVLRVGPHRLSLRKLKRAKHGVVDLGPLTPMLPDRLWTKDKRIQVAPDLFVAELDASRRALCEGEAGELDDDAGRDLTLIGRRHLRSNNTWLHNSARMVKGRDRCTLLVHPDDAASRDIEDGGTVTITSRTGSVAAPVQLSDEVMPGVVSLPHGWGHDREGVSWQTARANPGVSVNDVTDHQLLDTLTGNAAYNEVRVRVSPGG